MNVKKGLLPFKKNESRRLDASESITCHILGFVIFPRGQSNIDLLFPLSGRKSQLLQPSVMGGCMESCRGTKEASLWEVKGSSQKFIPMQNGS